MTSIYDESYTISKKYKKKEIELGSIEKNFIILLNNKYNTNILCFFYDYVTIAYEKIPRLDIVIERTREYNKFLDKNHNFKSQIQNEIKSEFQKLEIYNKIENNKKLFVSFNNFEDIAIEEAHNHISDDELNEIAESIDKDNIWLIRKFFKYITIFLYRKKTSSFKTKKIVLDSFKNQYYSKLKQHDEFNYCTFDSLQVNFDTKENFEENYQGNWFYYYK